MNPISRRTLAPRRLLLALACAAGLLAVPATATADVEVDGTGEPAFTSSSNNTQFVAYGAPSGSDAYRLTAVYLRDGVEVRRETIDTTRLSGSLWLNWSDVVPLPLEQGRTYEICVSGAYSLPNDPMFFPDMLDSCEHGDLVGKRTATTIDRSKPVVSVQAAGGAATTRSTLLPLKITYDDAHSQPNPANFLCVAPGDSASEACDSRIYGYDAGCSQPAASARNTTFSCQVETAGLVPPDGRIFACVIAADSSVPDRPDSPDQSVPSGQANLSDKTCTSVILDRTQPTAAFNVPSTVTSGQELPFTAQVSDAHSGVAPGSVRWIWNDGTPAASGASATHAFSRPGTYNVQLQVADAAGNKTTVSKPITVLAPPTTGDGDVAECRSAMKALAAAKVRLGKLKREAAPARKIRRAKAAVKRARLAAGEACAS